MNQENLSPYQRWQLEKYGNIITEGGTYQPDEDRLSTAETAYIFEQENPELCTK